MLRLLALQLFKNCSYLRLLCIDRPVNFYTAVTFFKSNLILTMMVKVSSMTFHNPWSYIHFFSKDTTIHKTGLFFTRQDHSFKLWRTFPMWFVFMFTFMLQSETSSETYLPLWWAICSISCILQHCKGEII